MIKSRFILYSSGMALALIGTVGASIAIGTNKPTLPSIGADPKETRNYRFETSNANLSYDGASSFSLPLITMPSERLSISLSATSNTTLTIPATIDPEKSLCSISRASTEYPWNFSVTLRLDSALVTDSESVKVFVKCKGISQEGLAQTAATPAGDGKTDYIFSTDESTWLSYEPTFSWNIDLIRVTFSC